MSDIKPGSNTAFLGGSVVSCFDAELLPGTETRKRSIIVSVPGLREDEPEQVRVAIFGEGAIAATKKCRGKYIELEGTAETSEWPVDKSDPEGKKHSSVNVSVNDASKITLLDEKGREVNRTDILGDILWIGENRPYTWTNDGEEKSAPARSMFVSAECYSDINTDYYIRADREFCINGANVIPLPH